MNRILALAVLSATLAGPVVAHAAHPPSASVLNEDMGATTGLGSSHRFATPQAAMNHCPDDVIVWSGGRTLTYLMPGMPGYGAGSHGFYACKMEADSAGFSPR